MYLGINNERMHVDVSETCQFFLTKVVVNHVFGCWISADYSY